MNPAASQKRSAEFDAAIVANQRAMMSFAMKLSKNRTSAEDLVQEATMRALLHHDQFCEGTNMKAWLRRIVFTVFATGHRRSKRMVQDTDGHFAATIPQNEGQLWSVELKEIQSAIRGMPKIYRDCILRIAVNGETYEDVAEELGVPIGTVKSRVNRGKEYLEAGRSLAIEEECAPQPVETSPAPVDLARVADLYAEGLSASEIAAKYPGTTGGEIAALLAGMKHRRRK